MSAWSASTATIDKLVAFSIRLLLPGLTLGLKTACPTRGGALCIAAPARPLPAPRGRAADSPGCGPARPFIRPGHLSESRNVSV
jgi:hypothetical protein